jgi:hypothetical protein
MKLRKLAFNLDRYFIRIAGTRLVPVKRLLLTRARVQGITNANALMSAAYDRKATRRVPITVSLHGGYYKVKDGNSTAINAIFSSWPSIWVVISLTTQGIIGRN